MSKLAGLASAVTRKAEGGATLSSHEELHHPTASTDLRLRRHPRALPPLIMYTGPSVPAESPTLGFTDMQFEALPAAAREPASP
jgi:hypothetical protein